MNQLPIKYEIQTQIVGDWENTWTDENGMAVMFDTQEEADKELKDYLRHQHDAVDSGDMEDKYDPDTFRVVPLKQCPYCTGWKEYTVRMFATIFKGCLHQVFED